MQLIAPVVPRPVGGLSQPIPTNSGSYPAFQMAPAAQSSSQNFTPTANPALGTQTLSALLQTQDIGHTHGYGGGHHGVKSLARDVVHQETVVAQEVQSMSASKKLTNIPKLHETSDADPPYPEDTPNDDAHEKDENRPHQKEKRGD